MNGQKVLLGLLACVLLTSAFETEVESDNYIVGGRPAQPGRFPWIVSLRTVLNQHFCGGFILSNRWVGTAARCTQGRMANPNAIFAVTAAHSRSDGVQNRIARVFNHPRFNQRYMNYDVSLLQTGADIVFNARVRPVAFPTGPVVHGGTNVLFAGWGLTKYPRGRGQGVAPVLQWMNTRMIPRGECQQRHGQRARMVHPETVCTSNFGGKGACSGDYGSPLILPVRNGPGVIIGIFSWGVPCARGYPDVYTQFWSAIPFFRAASQNTIPNLPQGPR